MRFTAIAKMGIRLSNVWIMPVLQGIECSPSPALRFNRTPKAVREMFASVLPKLWQRYCAGVVMNTNVQSPERSAALDFMRTCYMPHRDAMEATYDKEEGGSISMDIPEWTSVPETSQICSAFLQHIAVLPYHLPNKPVEEWKAPNGTDEEMAEYVESLMTNRLNENDSSVKNEGK